MDPEYFYQLGTIDIPSGASLLQVTFMASHYDEDNYSDLVLISPNNEVYDYVRFRGDGIGDVDVTDVDGNSYTGYTSDPEVMKIHNPVSGIWMVGVYPQYEIGDVSYKLSANFNIVKFADEVVPEEQ